MQAKLIIDEFSCLYDADTIVRRCTAAIQSCPCTRWGFHRARYMIHSKVAYLSLLGSTLPIFLTLLFDRLLFQFGKHSQGYYKY